MTDSVLTPVLPRSSLAVPSHKPETPAKIHDAAQQFEALLIGQILQSVSEGGGWLGSGDDSASSCATGFAQEQLATMMAKNGGFGLADLISKGLERDQHSGG
jgi:Rod binding domain-containing protein